MQMETVIRLADIPGISFSGAGMGVDAHALYIRNLELRWMEDQRRIRDLERALDEPVSLPVRRGMAAL